MTTDHSALQLQARKEKIKQKKKKEGEEGNFIPPLSLPLLPVPTATNLPHLLLVYIVPFSLLLLLLLHEHYAI